MNQPYLKKNTLLSSPSPKFNSCTPYETSTLILLFWLIIEKSLLKYCNTFCLVEPTLLVNIKTTEYIITYHHFWTKLIRIPLNTIKFCNWQVSNITVLFFPLAIWTFAYSQFFFYSGLSSTSITANLSKSVVPFHMKTGSTLSSNTNAHSSESSKSIYDTSVVSVTFQILLYLTVHFSVLIRKDTVYVYQFSSFPAILNERIIYIYKHYITSAQTTWSPLLFNFSMEFLSLDLLVEFLPLTLLSRYLQSTSSPFPTFTN